MCIINAVTLGKIQSGLLKKIMELKNMELLFNGHVHSFYENLNALAFYGLLKTNRSELAKKKNTFRVFHAIFSRLCLLETDNDSLDKMDFIQPS